jgi:hypothetical protein
VFSEKIQSKLFNISNSIIKSTLFNKLNEGSKDSLIINNKSQCKSDTSVQKLIEKENFIKNEIA